MVNLKKPIKNPLCYILLLTLAGCNKQNNLSGVYSGPFCDQVGTSSNASLEQSMKNYNQHTQVNSPFPRDCFSPQGNPSFNPESNPQGNPSVNSGSSSQVAPSVNSGSNPQGNPSVNSGSSSQVAPSVNSGSSSQLDSSNDCVPMNTPFPLLGTNGPEKNEPNFFFLKEFVKKNVDIFERLLDNATEDGILSQLRKVDDSGILYKDFSNYLVSLNSLKCDGMRLIQKIEKKTITKRTHAKRCKKVNFSSSS